MLTKRILFRPVNGSYVPDRNFAAVGNGWHEDHGENWRGMSVGALRTYFAQWQTNEDLKATDYQILFVDTGHVETWLHPSRVA